MTTGEVMRSFRKSKGISVRQLEREAAVSRHDIERYETDVRSPTLAHLERIYVALSKRPDAGENS